MKKILLFSLLVLTFAACKKENDPDVRDSFVGTYDLSVDMILRGSSSNETINGFLPDSLPYTFTDTLTIAKDESDMTKVNVSSKVYNCSAIVSGNHLLLESENNPDMKINLGEVLGIQMLQGVELPINYSMVHKTADLNENVLTWHTDATGNGSVDVPMLGSISFNGSASLENTATKK